ncbi:MAG: GNAT family N-acetyltransferase [candidate division WOR-3 bacterium]|nr:MAG: GNAT family N-acetyltransferase [candidate division WOR-3 bacterium]
MTKAKEISKRRSGFVVREFRITDYDALIKLWKGAGLPHKPRGRDRKKDISREITHVNAVFLVAEKEGILIGSAFGTHDGRKGWINRVAVLPDFRRSGIAAQLVREVEKRLNDAGIDIIACLIEEWNKESVAFFERLGYKRHNDIFYFTKRRYPDI